MKFIILLSMLFFVAAAHANHNKALKFASSIKEAIRTNDIESLKAIKCYPVQNNCVSKRSIDYIFGKNNNGQISKLLSNKDTNTKIYGPYTYELKKPNSSYVILYYNPRVIKLSKNGLLSQNIEKEQWNKNLIETVVTVINGEVHLNRTIFYYGAHAPWAGDYGL